MPAVRDPRRIHSVVRLWIQCRQGKILSQDEADVEPGSIKGLIVRDNRKKALFAHVVPVKSIDDKTFVVKSVVDDVEWLDYTKVVLKTDNEPAIFILLQESLRDLKIEVLDQVMHGTHQSRIRSPTGTRRSASGW